MAMASAKERNTESLNGSVVEETDLESVSSESDDSLFLTQAFHKTGVTAKSDLNRENTVILEPRKDDPKRTSTPEKQEKNVSGKFKLPVIRV